MKRNSLSIAVLGICLAGLVHAGEPHGGLFDLVATTVDGGGGTSSGGQFALTGSIGQPDAGLLTGGEFTLHGGFIGVLAEPTVGGDAVLTITLNGTGNAVMTWNQPGYTLEFRDALASPPAWQPVNPQPVEQSFTTPATRPARFFRLRKL